ncbi:hypothetical protein N2152v2_002724 [Parachlorella kessleri]
MAGIIMVTMNGAEPWDLAPASPALEPLLHLALGEFNLLDNYAYLASHPSSSHFKLLHLAVFGLTGLLLLQHRLLYHTLVTSPSKGHEPAIMAALEQRMWWVSAGAAFARVLHAAADAAADSAGHGHANETVVEALQGLDTALGLISAVFICFKTGRVIIQGCPSQLPTFAQLPGVVKLLLEVAELLLRLTAKRPALDKLVDTTLAQAHGDLVFKELDKFLGNRGITDSVGCLLVEVSHLRLLNDAERGGGLGPLLKHYLGNLPALVKVDEAVTLLLLLSILLTAEHAEGLAVALVKGGLLQAAAEHSAVLLKGRSREPQKMEGTSWVFLTAGAVLTKAVCSMLDKRASTGLLATFSTLLGDVPSMDASTDVGLEELHTIRNGSSNGSISGPRGPWVVKFYSKQAWEQLCSEVIPTVLETCGEVISSSQQEQKAGMFNDVAVSAWTCCNPGCTNMAGQQEVSLALSRQCQRQDWRRHKAICQAIKELK